MILDELIQLIKKIMTTQKLSDQPSVTILKSSYGYIARLQRGVTHTNFCYGWTDGLDKNNIFLSRVGGNNNIAVLYATLQSKLLSYSSRIIGWNNISRMLT